MKRIGSSAQAGKDWRDLETQQGRVFIVTGASSGIGEAVARSLGKTGARVILAVRNPEKARRIFSNATGTFEIRKLDLSDLTSIREFAKAIGAEEKVDVLVHNAGVMGSPYGRTCDGLETQIATNHLGPFALTGLLLPLIQDRVVVVSSHAHRQGRIRLKDLHFEKERYDSSAAYAQSKLANLLFVYELQRRLEAAGSKLRALAAHPGLAQSSLLSNCEPTRRLKITRYLQGKLGQSAENGALPVLFAATADVPGGSYVGPGGFLGLRGQPCLVGSNAQSKDLKLASELWTLSESLTRVCF